MSIHKLSFAIVLSSSALLCSQVVAQSGTVTEVPSAAPAVQPAPVTSATPQVVTPQAAMPQTVTPQATTTPQAGVTNSAAQPATTPQASGTVAPDNATPAAPAVDPVAEANALKDKFGMVMGYNLARNWKSKNADADFNQVLQGIRDAAGDVDKSSYVFGYQVMSKMKEDSVGVSAGQLEVGVKKAMAGEELGMSDQEVQMLMMAFGRMVEENRIAELKKTVEENTAAGEAYIAEQKAANPNLKELGEGVYYEVLTEGDGPKPGEKATVLVDYTGSFTDGEVFDSSVKPLGGEPGEPAEFRVGGVIPGFTESLLAMPAGSKWRVIIPGEKAYGTRGSGGKIGPMQTLVFEIELLKIVDDGEKPAAGAQAPAMNMTPEMRASIEAQMKAAIEAQKKNMTPEMKAKIEAEMKSALDNAKDGVKEGVKEGAKE